MNETFWSPYLLFESSGMPTAHFPGLEGLRMSDSLYETDFYLWTQRMAEIIRQGRWDELIGTTSCMK